MKEVMLNAVYITGVGLAAVICALCLAALVVLGKEAYKMLTTKRTKSLHSCQLKLHDASSRLYAIKVWATNDKEHGDAKFRALVQEILKDVNV